MSQTKVCLPVDQGGCGKEKRIDYFRFQEVDGTNGLIRQYEDLCKGCAWKLYLKSRSKASTREKANKPDPLAKHYNTFLYS